MLRAVPRWKIEIRAATTPQVVWVTVVLANDRRATFAEQEDATRTLEQLQRVQPHAVFRLAPM